MRGGRGTPGASATVRQRAGGTGNARRPRLRQGRSGGYCSGVKAEPSGLAELTFSLAGAGRVGSSLAHWTGAAGARAVAVGYRSSAGRAGELAAELGAVATPLAELATGGQDLLLVAVADPALPEVARRLAARPQARVVLHTSGAVGAAVLSPLAGADRQLGSVHPLKAFPRVLARPEEAHRVFFALDGDPEARALGERLVAAWGGVAGTVPGELRTLYHLAAWLSAGGVTTLLATAARVADRAGLPPEVVGGYLGLARGALAAAEAAVAAGGGPAEVITGPVARGDDETLARQLAALEEKLPELLPLVAVLGRATLDRLGERGPLSDDQDRLAQRLARVLGF